MVSKEKLKKLMKIFGYIFIYLYFASCVFGYVFILLSGKITVIGIISAFLAFLEMSLIIYNSNMRVDNFKSVIMDLFLPIISTSFFVILSVIGVMLNRTVIENKNMLLVCDIFILIGYIVSLFSVITLGRYFAVFAEANGLISKGIYKYVRNPIYLGYIISNIALALKFFSIKIIVIVILWLILIVIRTIEEEKVLGEAFQDEYETYKNTTGRFLPKLSIHF